MPKLNYGNIMKVVASDLARWGANYLNKASSRMETGRKDGFAPFLNALTGEVQRGGTGERLIVSYQTLARLAATDPVTWAIHNKIRDRITRMAPQVSPDIDAQQAELDAWESLWLSYLSPFAVDPDPPKFDPLSLSDDTALFVLQKCSKLRPGIPGASKQVGWIFEQAAMMERAPMVSSAESTLEFLLHCNNDSPLPLNNLVDRILSDSLRFDLGFWASTMTLGREPYELYDLPGDEIVLFKEQNRATPMPPDRAYGWRPLDKIVADFTTQDALCFIRNPQKDGLGMSPVEAVFHTITGTLFADAYNLDMFQSNIPPGVLNLGDISDTERRRFRMEWENEVMGRSRMHRLLFVNSPDKKLDFTPLKNMNTQEMQYMEYLHWAALVKCMVHGVSPQDIGITQSVHKETSKTQMDISSEGVDDLATGLENSITEGLIRRCWGKKNLKFTFERKEPQTQIKDIAEAEDLRIKNGTLTRNEARRKNGMKPFATGGDVATIIIGPSILAVDTITEETGGPDEKAMLAALTAKQPGQEDQDPEDGSQDPKPEELGDSEKSLSRITAYRKGKKVSGLADARTKRNRIFTAAESHIRAFAGKRAAHTMTQIKSLLKKGS